MRILVAECDRSVATFLRRALEAESYAVDIASSGNDAVHMVDAVDFDLVTLALLLPGTPGLKVLRHIRTDKQFLPVLILTRVANVEDRVKALDLGADDYMTKPFAVREVVARVRALLRRTNISRDLTLRVADLEMDRVARIVRRGKQRVELSSKEFALLEYLLRNAGRALTRAMIVDHVWDFSFDPGSNVVDVYINYLRKKVDHGFDKELIHTVRGVGYRIGDPE